LSVLSDRRKVTALFFGASLLLGLLPGSNPLFADEGAGWLPGLLEREEITMVITDSGLGGLSVVADAAEKLRRHRGFRKVDLVFVNALFSDQGGYNGLASREEKAAVIDSALHAMSERYDPDLVLVACNTLSVIVDDTPFARSGATPWAGIVETGSQQIAGFLEGRPNAMNLMFATRTTVEEGEHLEKLLAAGIAESQFVAQACPQLTQYIEQGYDAMDTELLIDAYVDEALSSMGAVTGPLSVSFNCTHFGYSMDAWKKAFGERDVEVAAWLDPNRRMVDFLLPEESEGRYEESEVTVKVVSMVDIPAASIDSIGRWLHGVSPVTEAALRDYEQVDELFEWRGLVSRAFD
jgi:glutamate racemase